jgi:hypothetical protein
MRDEIHNNYNHDHHHHQWQRAYFLSWPSLQDAVKTCLSWVRPSSFHFFGFHKNYFYRARLSALRPTHNLEDQVSIFISLSDKVAQLYPWALASFFITFCNLQGYSGGTLAHLHTWVVSHIISVNNGWFMSLFTWTFEFVLSCLFAELPEVLLHTLNSTHNCKACSLHNLLCLWLSASYSVKAITAFLAAPMNSLQCKTAFTFIEENLMKCYLYVTQPCT